MGMFISEIEGYRQVKRYEPTKKELRREKEVIDIYNKFKQRRSELLEKDKNASTYNLVRWYNKELEKINEKYRNMCWHINK